VIYKTLRYLLVLHRERIDQRIINKTAGETKTAPWTLYASNPIGAENIEHFNPDVDHAQNHAGALP
jgi:predicted oxidoreductase (fatty acid repression mutant protein)